MNHLVRSIAVLLLSASLVQSVGAQFNVSGPGFLPDENGTNLDDPQAKKGTPKVAAGSVIKDCAECPEMVVIPAGSFVMGSKKEPTEKPPHDVYVRSFLMGKTPVTQKQWLDLTGTNPSRFSSCGPDCPVENVSWNHIQRFISKLNEKTAQKYRLPSEAEWEYAARGGTTTDWSFGNDESKLSNYAWYRENSFGETHRVGQKLPNAFGLFDMHGNVWEWMQDCWHSSYAGAPVDGSAWTSGCTGDYRVIRGGDWLNAPEYLRSATRNTGMPGLGGGGFIGFRLARDL